MGLLQDYQTTIGFESSRSTETPSHPRAMSRSPGDLVEFVRESPDAVEVWPGHPHVKTWTVRNTGTVAWKDRQLQRTGRLSDREVPYSDHTVPIERTDPGEDVELRVTLHCAREAGTRILRFKMTNADGQFCFPDDDFGITVEVTSRPITPP